MKTEKDIREKILIAFEDLQKNRHNPVYVRMCESWIDALEWVLDEELEPVEVDEEGETS